MCFRINERTCVAAFTRATESSRSELHRFLSRLNETSGRLGEIGAVSGSDCKKILRSTFLAAKLLGWKVCVKGNRTSLF